MKLDWANQRQNEMRERDRVRGGGKPIADMDKPWNGESMQRQREKRDKERRDRGDCY